MGAAPAATATLGAQPGVTARMRRLIERESILAYIFMTPGGIVLLLFMAYPFFLGIYLSLTDRMVGFPSYHFIGLQNYRDLLQDPIFKETVSNTFIYSFFTVPFKLVLGLILALLLNQTFHFSRFVRAALLLPWIVPTALSALAWLMIYDPVLSPISWVLKDWGLVHSNINFLGTRTNAMASLCVANIWRGIPFFAVSILAGLQAVPSELNEAAALDGANAYQRFKAVTWPVIRGVTLIATLFSIIWTFSDFQLIYVLTKGGPANSTHVFGTYAYNTGVGGASELGMGAAISLAMFPALAVFAVILLRYVRASD